MDEAVGTTERAGGAAMGAATRAGRTGRDARDRVNVSALRAERTGRFIVVGWTFLLVAAVLWPFAFPGMPMLRDMVVPPNPALTDAAWGLGESAARAAPQDALLALVGGVADAGMVVRVLMFAALAVGGVAAAELVRRTLGAGVVGQIAAVTMLLWNPFVVERLLQGQWSLVLAMALLPAIALASIAAAPWWRATAMACAGLTPTGALLGIGVAVVAARSWRDRAIAVVTGVVVSLPWLVPTVLGALAGAGGGAGAGSGTGTGAGSGAGSAAGAILADPAGAAAFAARAEQWVGTLGAVAGLGGIWNRQAVPDARETGPAALAIVALLALFIVGAKMAWGAGGPHRTHRSDRRRPDHLSSGRRRSDHLSSDRRPAPLSPEHHRRSDRRRLIVLAVASVLVVAAMATPPGIALMAWALETIPGAGLARDAQKWVAFAVPGYVILAAAGAETIARQIPDRRRWLAATFAVVVIIAAVPDLPRAVAPVKPVAPWPGWSAVSGLVAMDDSAVAVLPAGPYRIIDGRPTYDPAVKTLPAPVVATGDLVVSGVSVGGEGTTAATVENALLNPLDVGADAVTAPDAAAPENGAPENDAPGNGAPENGAPDGVGAAITTLRNNGVGWVLVESSPGEFGDSTRVLDRLEVVYSDAHLTLHRVPGAIAPVEPADRTPAWVALLAWVAMALAGPIRGLLPTRP
ncbi:hypothetical protein ACFWGD_07815 [Corynebacterium sp. NPDC060344]|uniref:hypothetical protein n=1 Tax=Corynebacterium sp. NPDC060344 TaxID=3347101 RepID=UPI00365CF86B